MEGEQGKEKSILDAIDCDDASRSLACDTPVRISQFHISYGEVTLNNGGKVVVLITPVPPYHGPAQNPDTHE